jgi:uncharacterized protein with PQ loop repeat
MELPIIGFIAASTSVVAFSTQILHTVRSHTTAGLSISRSVLDVVSLVTWIVYATRSEDIPLLIARSCELITSAGVLYIIMRNHKKGRIAIKDFTPPNTEDSVCIDVKPERRNSV